MAYCKSFSLCDAVCFSAWLMALLVSSYVMVQPDGQENEYTTELTVCLPSVHFGFTMIRHGLRGCCVRPWGIIRVTLSNRSGSGREDSGEVWIRFAVAISGGVCRYLQTWQILSCLTIVQGLSQRDQVTLVLLGSFHLTVKLGGDIWSSPWSHYQRWVPSWDTSVLALHLLNLEESPAWLHIQSAPWSCCQCWAHSRDASILVLHLPNLKESKRIRMFKGARTQWAIEI